MPAHHVSGEVSHTTLLNGHVWKYDLDFGTLPLEFGTLIAVLASCSTKEAPAVLGRLKPFAGAYLHEIHVLAESGDLVLARRLPRLMAYVQDEQSIDVLFRLLRFPNPRVIEHALKALSVFRTSEIRDRVRQFCYSPEVRVRVQAIRLMVGQEELDEYFLLSHLRDRAPDVRHAAVQALGQKGTKEAIVRCLDLLSDPAEAVRIAVCRIAGRAGQEGVERLRACLAGDRSDHVKRQALLALIACNPDEGTTQATTLLFDSCTPDLLAASALEALLKGTTGEFRERVLAFSSTRPGISVEKVRREWLSDRDDYLENSR